MNDKSKSAVVSAPLTGVRGILSKHKTTAVTLGLSSAFAGAAFAAQRVGGNAELERTVFSGAGSISMLGAWFFLKLDKRIQKGQSRTAGRPTEDDDACQTPGNL